MLTTAQEEAAIPVKLNSTGGGSVTLTVPSTASDFTQSLPAGNGTILTTAGVTTPVEFAAGTAALPSITTTGDTNTGLYFPAADTVATTTGGTERMRVDSSGNVGIGTSSPTDKLQVNTQDGVRLGASGSVSYARIGSANTGESTAQISYDRSSGATIISQGNTGSALNERMRIDSSGNVGIGTSSPSTGIANRILAINGTDAGIHFLVSGTDTSRIYTSAGELRLQTSTAIPTVFYTNNTERMRIDSSGRVSIGSTTVNALLTVDGLGPTINNQAFAYYAQSGGAAISGYATGQNVTNSIWASDRVSGGEFNARSDARLKKDITPIPASDALHFVQSVMPVHYKWISGPDDGHKFGFIAQDVVKAGFPNLVGQYPDSNVQEVTDADGFTSPAGVMLTVNYDQIVPVLASALRDALAQIDDLKARLTALEAK